jgi:threonine/homoserine/homoserine lactone efflux protein
MSAAVPTRETRVPLAMRKLAGLFSVAFVTGLSGALMPGPVLAIVVAGAARWGTLAGIVAILGHAAVEIPVVALLMAGLGALVARPRVLAAIGLVGGLALVLCGADMLRSAAAVGSGLAAATAPVSLLGMALAGAGASLANPYFALWWATIGAGQIATVGPRSPAAWTAFYSGHVSSDFLWYALVAFAVGSGRKVLGAGGHQALIVICGVALLALGCYFMYAGVRRARSEVKPDRAPEE